MGCVTGIPSGGSAGGFHSLWPQSLSVSFLPWGLQFMSDLHLGSAHTDEDLIRAEMKHAQMVGDRILLNGDIFDNIFPSDSKRYRPSALAPFLQGCDDPINKILDYAEAFFSPFKSQIDLLGVGNHESNTEHRHHVDLVLLLAERLQLTHAYGGYSGFVNYSSHCRIFYHHGWGKGSSLSGSAQDLTTILNSVEGVDVVWLGHKHSRMSGHVCRLIPPSSAEHPPSLRDIRFVRTGSYVRSHILSTPSSVKEKGRQASYALDAGFTPVGLGGARVLIDFSGVKVVQ